MVYESNQAKMPLRRHPRKINTRLLSWVQWRMIRIGFNALVTRKGGHSKKTFRRIEGELNAWVFSFTGAEQHNRLPTVGG